MGSSRRKRKVRKEIKDQLSERLLRMRLLRNMTQGDLAAEAGVAIYTIVQAENGRTKPHPSTIRKLATALDCNVEDLIML
jgi:serine-type D-Ala-D-Ala carboxypeptidase/endopeptidase